jgi:hypothetical protein
MMRAVRDAGFTPVPEDVQLIVTGALEEREGRFVLVLDHMKEPRTLTCLPAGPGDALERALAQNAGRAVQIHGHWQFEGQGSIRVETVESPPDVP